MKGTIPRESKWDIVVDLFFYREPEEAEKEEQAAKEFKEPVAPKVEEPAAITHAESDWPEEAPAVPAPATFVTTGDWATEVTSSEWSTNATPAEAPVAQANWGSAAEWAN